MSKMSNSVERNDNFLAKARKLSILSTSLDIFDIRQHYIRILYISLHIEIRLTVLYPNPFMIRQDFTNFSSCTVLILNLFPIHTFLDSSKWKSFADDNVKFDENCTKFSKLVENTVRKGEIARYEQFLLFPQCFQ